jgi:hypothetical protein
METTYPIIGICSTHCHQHFISACDPYLEPDGIQSIPLQLIYPRPSVMLSFHLALGLPNWLFASGFLIKTLYTFASHACYIPCPSHPLCVDYSNNIW